MDISIISIMTIINILFAGIVVFFERKEIGATWAWLMVLIFIPVLGFFIYIFLGRSLKQKNFFKLSANERAYLKHAAEDQALAIHQMGPLLNKHSDLVKMNLKSSNALVTMDNEVMIFHDGNEKFDSLFTDIQHAKKEINIQYFIIKRDSLGKRLRDALTKKAQEGVKVRLLYDEIGSRQITRSFFKELIAKGGEVEAFFPSPIRLVNFRINNRNHRKLCIIDGEIAYIGGFNVGNEYLGLSKRLGYWRDTHLRIIGGAVDHIQGRFILDWNKATKHHKENLEQFMFRPEKHTGACAVQIIASGPNSRTEHLKNMYLKLMTTAKKSIYIQTPYFVPDSSFMDACKIALLSGVDLRIMIPNKSDHLFVRWATLSSVGQLLPYGAKILLYENGFLHAKTIIVDEEVASAGTTNVDTRSFRLNFEVNALLYDEKVAKQLQDLFIQDSEVCTELTSEKYAARPLLIKMIEAVARLLSPIL
ncbi:cardiolipin synthase [Gorillibacterium massiliense]|uniref:cardiolipin synthase n=1 Tax=Gorillibacterium massiliense TaxID=1280390 RepID=UPI0004BA7AAA|nr:cardiolipin synthase [Gorillibacterium massiliense]